MSKWKYGSGDWSDGSHWSGGEVDARSTPQLADNAIIVSDNADLTLSGAASVIQSFDTTSATQVSLDATLASIGTKGAFNLLGGRDFSAAGDLLNAGAFVLGGETLGAAKLTNKTGATLSGFGTISSTTAINDGTMTVQGTGGLVVDSGSLQENGASLTINGNVTGTGNATITGATVDFAAQVATTQTVALATNSTGVLDLGQSHNFHGTVAGLAAGDAINLSDFLFSNNSKIAKITSAGAQATDTDVTVKDGTLTTTLHLLNHGVNQFSTDPSAYTFTSDNTGFPTAETLFQLASHP